MSSDQRDPELEKLAQRITDSMQFISPLDPPSWNQVFYELLERQVIEVGPGLFHD